MFHPIQTHGSNARNYVPEDVALRAYEVYCALYGPQPAMVDVAKGCRGGFSANEMIAFLYARSFPRAEWQQRFDEALASRRMETT